MARRLSGFWSGRAITGTSPRTASSRVLGRGSVMVEAGAVVFATVTVESAKLGECTPLM